MSEVNQAKQVKAKKPKGPIRYEAVIPITIIFVLSYAYFTYYFDRHLRQGIEYVATQGNGAEVNIAAVHTSFLKASFELSGLQVTDKEKPSQNILELESVRFKYLWDALLRLKFVVDEASINNIQIYKPRKSPGFVLPPEPAKPSKMNEIQIEIISQIKNKYHDNALGDLMGLLEGQDPKAQLEKIRATLKSETRVKEMLADVQAKKIFWDGKIKELSDTSKLKAIETDVQAISKSKNIMDKIKAGKELADKLKEVQAKVKDVKASSEQFQKEFKVVSQYPTELQGLVKEDMNSLKSHLSIPKVDVKELAMNLFAGQFAEYIAKVRKYQALAKQYIPEKKEAEEPVVPPKRSEGKTYHFKITTGYPLFWLKRAAISSSGTAQTYSGNLSGELLNVSTDAKLIKKPIVLNVGGDFPKAQVSGMKLVVTVDHTTDIPKQTVHMQVNSFAIPEKMFVNSDKLKFGIQNATGTTNLLAQIQSGEIKASWNNSIQKPNYVVETPSKLGKEILTNVLNGIPVIYINGTVKGPWKDLDFDIDSNLGDGLANGFKEQLGTKIAEGEAKLKEYIHGRIGNSEKDLLGSLAGSGDQATKFSNINELYKKNEDRIKAEIAKVENGQKDKALDSLKEQGKKLFKGIKF